MDKRLEEAQKKLDRAVKEHKAAMKAVMRNLEPRDLMERHEPQETIEDKPGYRRPMLENYSPRSLLEHHLKLLERDGYIHISNHDKVVMELLDWLKRSMEGWDNRWATR